MVETTFAHETNEQKMIEPAAMSRLLRETARAWTRSFGVSNDFAERRLIMKLRSALDGDMIGFVAQGSLHETLDQAAHTAIANWLAHVTGNNACHNANEFAMLRCAFLSANRNGDWSERFLDTDQASPDLNMALQAQMMCPTPARHVRTMPRQSLERQAS